MVARGHHLLARVLKRVSHNADDFIGAANHGRIEAAVAQPCEVRVTSLFLPKAFSNRFFARPEQSGRRFIDQCASDALAHIAAIQPTSLFQRYAQDAQRIGLLDANPFHLQTAGQRAWSRRDR